MLWLAMLFTISNKIYKPGPGFPMPNMGPSWSWLYGSWIYNYLCNQCLSPLKVVSLNPTHGEVYSIQHHVIKFVSDLQQVCGFLRVPPLIKLTPTK